MHLDRPTIGIIMSGFTEVVIDPVATTGVLSAKLWIRRGSGDDPLGQRGGHQLLGSVLSRGCGPLDHVQLADLVEGCGAGLRCDTHEDGILVSLKCTQNDADKLLPILGWMLQRPHLNPAQIALEKELSLQALQRQQEDPFQRAFDGWRQLAYGKGPYGHDPLGVTADVEALDQNQLIALAAAINDGGSVLALSGTIPEGLQDILQGWGDGEPQASSQGESAVDNGSQKLGQTSTLNSVETEQVVLMLGQATLPHGHPDDLALRVLQAHLGSGMSSLLFRRLREDHGVAYDVGLHHPARQRSAPFVMHASTGVERAQLTLELLMRSWEELLDSVIEQTDLDLAMAKFRGQLAHASQTTGQRAERRAQLRALGLPDDHDRRCVDQLNSLSGVALKTVALQHLKQPILSLCGPASSLSMLESVWGDGPFHSAEA